jgi:hypothetical protein
VLDKMKQMVGVMPLQQALDMAVDDKSDVILLNEDAQPPLVRICALSKYRYEQEKDKKEASKKQRAAQQEIKELKLSPRTEVHDLQVPVPAPLMLHVAQPVAHESYYGCAHVMFWLHVAQPVAHESCFGCERVICGLTVDQLKGRIL